MDSKLFVAIDGRPLKIYVETHDAIKSLKLVKLIKDNGGFSVRKPDEETIVLAEDDAYDEGQSKFQISWLTDSLREKKILILYDYILMPPTDAEETNGHRENLPRLNLQKLDGSLNDSSAPTFGTSERPRTSSGISSNVPSNIQSETKDENYESPSDVESFDFDDVNRDDTADQSPALSEDENYEESDHFERRSRKRKLTKYTVDENRNIVKYLINAINTNPRISWRVIWKRLKDRKILVSPHRSVNALSTHFKSFLKYNMHKYTTDTVGIAAVQRRFTIRKRRPSFSTFSTKEKEMMIQYLVDNEVINKALGSKVFEAMAATNFFKERDRSAKSLQNHFYHNLIFHYKRFTKEPRIREEFEKLLMKTRKSA